MDANTLHVGFLLLVMAFLIGLLLALLPLINQLKKTARRVEIAADSLNDLLNHELKPLLVRTERAVAGFEGLGNSVKAEVPEFLHRANRFALLGINTPFVPALIFWTLKAVWRKIWKSSKGN